MTVENNNDETQAVSGSSDSDEKMENKKEATEVVEESKSVNPETSENAAKSAITVAESSDTAKEALSSNKVESSSETKAASETKKEAYVKKPMGRGRPRNGAPGTQRNSGNRQPRYRRKVCRFCSDKKLEINYRESSVLEHYVTDRGKILPRRITGTCSRHQREVSRAIKRARLLSVLPFVVK